MFFGRKMYVRAIATTAKQVVSQQQRDPTWTVLFQETIVIFLYKTAVCVKFVQSLDDLINRSTDNRSPHYSFE